MEIEIPTERSNFGGCPARWKALGVCCGVRSKMDHTVLNNGTTCDVVVMRPFVKIL